MVKHEVVILVDGTYDVNANLLTSTLIALENLNMSSVDYLTKIGYDGGQFQNAAPKIDVSKKQLAVTEPRSLERQDLLSEQHTAGGRFTVTAGNPLNEDDAFIGWEGQRRQKSIKVLEDKKKKYNETFKAETDAMLVIGSFATEKNKDVSNNSHIPLLNIRQLKTLYNV